MHAVIFLGFVSLLAAQAAADRDRLRRVGDLSRALPAVRSPRSRTASRSPCSRPAATRSIGAWCRSRARLERNREALLILSLIIAIMVTDFASTLFASPVRADAIPASRTSAALRSPAARSRRDSRGLPRRRCGRAISSSTGCSSSLVFSFLVILPIGEHFHIVTALPTLFFRRGGPANAVPTVDLEKAMARATTRDAHRRAQRARPHLEGRPRRLHLHRMRPLQGRLPDLPDRQAAGAEVGLRQRQAPPAASSARRSCAGTARTTRCPRSCPTSSATKRCGRARPAAIARRRARSSSSTCPSSIRCASTG